MNYDVALDILGLTPETCTFKSLKTAYAKAAKQHRPEQAPEQFSKIRLAYESIQIALEKNQYALQLADGTALLEFDPKHPVAYPENLLSLLAKTEGLDLNNPALDPVLEEHRLEVMHLAATWMQQIPLFYETKHLAEPLRAAQQVALLTVFLDEPALDHYLTRQTFAEQLGQFLLSQTGDWVALEAFKFSLDHFDYEAYGWHQHSWTLHSALEMQMDTLREKTIFILNAQQVGSVEHQLITPMPLRAFAKVWFFRRKRTAALKTRLEGISQKYPQWLPLIDAKQQWRIQYWPNTSQQMACVLLGLFATLIFLLLTGTVYQLIVNQIINTGVPSANSNIINNNSILKGMLDILYVLGTWFCFIILNMTLLTKGSYYIQSYYNQLTNSVDINNNNNNNNNNTLLSINQKIYKGLRYYLTLKFFGRLEGVGIIILLLIWPFYTLGFLNNNNIALSLYRASCAMLGLLSYLYLKQLSKTERVLPNHPYLCTVSMIMGAYFLLNIKGNNYWGGVFFIFLMIRSQFPSFLKVNWADIIPRWRLFEHFEYLEEWGIKYLCGATIVVSVLTLIIGHQLAYPILDSILCLILYLWLMINADMDSPVMSTQSKILTIITVSIAFVAKNYIIYISNTNLVSILDWLLLTCVLSSMVWYGIYGLSQDYFSRWHAKPSSL